MRRIASLNFWGILALFLFSVNIAQAQSANIFFSTPPRQVYEGENVSVEIRVKSEAQSINAVSGIFSFPENLVGVISIAKDKSIIDIWTREPKTIPGKILFEGVILNPGFQGANGYLFKVTFKAKESGVVFFNFSEGAILANDGLGTNVLAMLDSANFRILPGTIPENVVVTPTEEVYIDSIKKIVALPVIIEYPELADSKDGFYLKGKGEPNALTKIVFKDLSAKSLGEKFITLLQTEKKKLGEVLVKNGNLGEFEYLSPKNLTAGVYNATPFLVDEDTNTEKSGFGVRLLVNDSEIVKKLIVFINILVLLIPIVGLGVIIYFIPWYSINRMKVIKKKLGVEAEKLDLTQHKLEHQDKKLDEN